MAKIEITCRLCGSMLSATADAADANLRTAAIRIFEQQTINHTEHGLTADWTISWKQ